MERLRHLATKQFELTNDIDTEHLKIKEHLDHTNEHTFEVEDLKKLILKTTADLAEADKKRRQEFKVIVIKYSYGDIQFTFCKVAIYNVLLLSLIYFIFLFSRNMKCRRSLRSRRN